MYSKTVNNRTGGADNEYRGAPGGPGTGFCSPGGGFCGNRRSGTPPWLLRLKNRRRDFTRVLIGFRKIPSKYPLTFPKSYPTLEDFLCFGPCKTLQLFLFYVLF